MSDWEVPVRARLMDGDDTALGEVYDQYSSFVLSHQLGLCTIAEGVETATRDDR